MEQLNKIVYGVYGQLSGVTGLISSFFGGLANLNLAPVYAASGVDGVAGAFMAIYKSITDLLGVTGVVETPAE